MIIAEFHAENFKNIRVVDITPDPDNPTVMLTGPNGAGKSSILDAIEAVIAGGKATKTKRPIRDGESHAEARTLFGDFDVLRTWDRRGDSDEFDTKLIVKQRAPEPNAEGERPYYHVARPQELLDRFWSALAMSPLAFLALTPKEQQAQLVGIVSLPFDPVKLDQDRALAYTERTDAGRELKQLEGQVAGYPKPVPDLPDVEQSASELVAKLRAVDDNNARRVQLADKIDDLRANIQASRDALAAAEETLASTESTLEQLPATQHTGELQEALDKIDETNAAIRTEQARQKAIADRDAAAEKVAALSQQITDYDQQRADGLAAAKFPVDGLGFDDDGVTYKGVPLSQASQAEQWESAFAIAAAANPDLRVFRIDQGSLIDSAHMQVITDLARKHDAQVWIEAVDETGEVGFVINEGRVVAQNGSKSA